MLSQLVSSAEGAIKLVSSVVLPAGFHVRLAQLGAEARAFDVVGGKFEYTIGLGSGVDAAGVRGLFDEWVSAVSADSAVSTNSGEEALNLAGP